MATTDRRLSPNGALFSLGTRAQHRPSGDFVNVSLDFNASDKGTARGTEVIVPDDASPQVLAAAHAYNNAVVAFARANGIPDYPNRGVKTRSENGRGVANTVHTEPFFNSDPEMQAAIKANPQGFASIYKDTFGSVSNARIIAPHGMGADRGAASDVFGNETDFGKLMIESILTGQAPDMSYVEGGNQPGVSITAGQGDTMLAGGPEIDTLQSLDPEVAKRLYDAYTSGRMSPQQRADYETDVRSGAISVPTGAQLAQPVNVQTVSADQSQRIYDAFIAGRMSDEQEQQYLSDVQSGGMISPATSDQLSQFSRQRHDPMSFGVFGMPEVTAREPVNNRTSLDLTAKYADKAGGGLFMDAGAGLIGAAPSPTGQATGMLGNMPVPGLGGMTLNRAGDAALTALGGIGAIGGGAAGLVGDTVELATGNRGSAERLSRDLSALPEAMAGSPMAMRGSVQRNASQAVVARDRQVTDQMREFWGKRQAQRPAMDTPAGHERPLAPPAAGTAGQSDMDGASAQFTSAARGREGAMRGIADQADVNPEAVAAADRLGIDAPVDVFADNAIVRQAAGMMRAVRSTDESAEWENTIVTAQKRAAEIMQETGASPDLASASERVQDALTTSITTLTDDANRMSGDIRGQIANDVRIAPPNTLRLIEEMGEEVGGIDNLDAPIRNLHKKLSADGGSTYGLLDQERRHIGAATFDRRGPYVDADGRNMRRIYDAMRADQESFVRVELGDRVADNYVAANDLYSQAFDLKADMVTAFGNDLNGSIANKLRSAVTNASRGDAAGLNRVMNVVPESLQRESLLSAINEVVTVQSGQGGFSFAHYAKTYRGLRENAPVYNQVSKVLGGDSANVMRDLYEVSARMDRASKNVPTTGASNQTLIADSALERFMNSTMGRHTRGAAAAAATTAAGAPMLGGTAAVAAASGRVGRNKQQALGGLFRDPRFQRMMIEAAQNNPTERSIQAVRVSPAYRNWARTSGIEDADAWLLETMARGSSLQEEGQ